MYQTKEKEQIIVANDILQPCMTNQKKQNKTSMRTTIIGKLAFFTMLVTMLVLSACTKNTTDVTNDMDRITKRGYLIVGLDDTFAPMGFRDENNKLTGFDVDLANAVGNEMAIDIRLQPIDWSMKETELQSKNIDLIWNGYTITEERKKKVNFSIPYLENRQVIVVMRDSEIENKDDLTGKTVAVQRQSSALDAVMADKELLRKLKNEVPVEYDTNLEVFMDLESLRVDAIVVDEVLADYLIQQRGPDNYRYLPQDMGAEQYGIGVRLSDQQLLDEMNTILQKLMQNGTFDEIKKRWFGDDR